MDWAMLGVTGLAAAAGVASACVAVVQARAARLSGRASVAARNESREARDESVRLAAEANAAFVRQAAAQERANELKEVESRPKPWSGPRFVSGEMYAMTNTSGRTIVVDHFDLEPDSAGRFFRIHGPEDNIYKFGDTFDFVKAPVAYRARKLTIVWRFQGEPDSEPNSFIIPL